MPLRANAKTILAATAALLALAAVLGALRLKRFVDEDPRLCATCHQASPEFALWMGGSHRSVACQKCHHARPEEGVAMLAAFIAGKKPSAHAPVQIGSCAECHFSHDPRWPQVGGSRGHRIHYEERKIACVRCHAASMHGFEPIAAKCAECHPGHSVGLAGMQGLHCFACHDFLSSDASLRPTRRDCLRCHTAQGIHAPVNDHGAAMLISCASCHKPHAPPGQTLLACTRCHLPDAIAKGGLHAAKGHARCVDCHPPHTWRADPNGCGACHAGAKAHARGGACADCHAFKGVALPPAPLVP